MQRGKGGSGIVRTITPTKPIERVPGTPTAGQYDYAFKVVLCGNSGVGKTTLCNTLVGRTSSATQATIGIDFATKLFELPETRKRVLMQVWDTAGQERYATLPNLYMRDAHVVCLVYDVASEESYRGILTRWRPAVLEFAPENAIVFVIANKIDKEAVLAEEKVRAEVEGAWHWTLLKSNALRADSVNPVMTTVASAAAAYAKAPSPRSGKRLNALLAIEDGKALEAGGKAPPSGTVVVSAPREHAPPNCYC